MKKFKSITSSNGKPSKNPASKRQLKPEKTASSKKKKEKTEPIVSTKLI
jgi:hypothetical protein